MEEYDFCIVGAGSAGMTAAILAARKKYSVVVVEKGEMAGPFPRGESVAPFPLLGEILGEGFVDSIATVRPSFRRYHSPNNLKTTLVNVHAPYRFFEWREFMDRFVKNATEAGVKFLYNQEVTDPILSQDKICVGVKCKDTKNNQISEIRAKVVLACDGHDSVIGKAFGIDYATINCPIVKFRGDNANVDIEKFPNPQFWLVPSGDLDYAPNFPPIAPYVFPIGGKKVEAGMMLRMGQVPKMKNVKIPTDEEIMEVWKRMKESYPGFSEAFKGITVEFEGLTGMPNAKLADNFVLGNGGAVLIGDSAGFVDANGSSGLYYGMQMAADWVSILDAFLAAEQKWSPQQSALLEKQFRKTKTFKHIKSSYGLIGISEALMFRIWKTGKAMNRNWGIFSFLIKSAS